ncbi:MAG: AhpC/TSA family protein [Rikenellaceae bacterium]|nr:AhpC/TSA family protein [Rikenellaceae bacterium]
MNKFCALLLVAALAASCHSSQTVKINGKLLGAPGQSVYLEKVTPSTKTIVDSTTTDKKGGFSFSVALEDKNPTFYNVVTRKGSAPLLLAPGERVALTSVGDKLRHYTVEGSVGSTEVKEVNAILKQGIASLDSLSNLYTGLPAVAANETLREQLVSAYTDAYFKVKRDQIKFIVTHPGSLAALYALYQRLPNDPVLFNGESDVVYYKMVADSVALLHPESPYLAALQKEISAKSTIAGINNMLNGGAVETISYPDIELPDMYGNKIRLSSLAGKAILLDFWIADDAGKLHNAELKEVYNEVNSPDFEIYQVSLDPSKSAWVSTVQSQKLPWISVSDFRGADSPAARLYNVQKVPANFLIDREGNIVGQNLSPDDLRAKLKEAL